MSKASCEKKKTCLTFQTILKDLAVRRAGGVAGGGCARLGGVVFSSLGQGPGAASELSEAPLPLHKPEALLGREGISVPVWGLSTQLALQGSLLPKETFEIFPSRSAVWKQQEIKVYSSDALLIKRQGSQLRITVFQATCYFYQMFSKAGLVHSI